MNHNIGPTGKHADSFGHVVDPGFLLLVSFLVGFFVVFFGGGGGACELKSMTLTAVLVSLQHEEPPGGTLDPGDGHSVGAHLGGVVHLGGAGRNQDPRRSCGGGPADQCLHPAAAGAGAEAVPAEQVPGPDGGGGEKQPAGGTCQQRCHFLSALGLCVSLGFLSALGLGVSLGFLSALGLCVCVCVCLWDSSLLLVCVCLWDSSLLLVCVCLWDSSLLLVCVCLWDSSLLLVCVCLWDSSLLLVCVCLWDSSLLLVCVCLWDSSLLLVCVCL